MANATNILVTLPLEPHHKERLNEAAGDTPCAFVYALEPTDDQLAAAQIIVGMVPVERLAKAERLEWLQLSWAGAGPYCSAGALPQDVLLTCASGAYGLTCSEHLLAFTFDLIRRFPAYHRFQAAHRWEAAGQVSSIEGSTVVVLGLGDIGGDYARKIQVLPEADIVAMALPDTPDTAGIIDEHRLRLMKPNAYLLNVGRGNAIEPNALKAVLREGLLAGVALDVTDPEPLPDDDYLWNCERVFVTPHVAGQLFLPETLNRIVEIAASNLSAWLAGQPLQSVVDRTLRY